MNSHNISYPLPQLHDQDELFIWPKTHISLVTLTPPQFEIFFTREKFIIMNDLLGRNLVSAEYH